MSDEQLKEFLEAVEADVGLQEKLKAAADDDAVVMVAKEAGFVVTADQLSEVGQQELSIEELEGVAGGFDIMIPGGGVGLQDRRRRRAAGTSFLKSLGLTHDAGSRNALTNKFNNRQTERKE